MVHTEDRWGFDKWAESYDEDLLARNQQEDWIFEDYHRVLGKVVEYCELSKNNYSIILDIGIGTGNLAAQFLRRGLHVIGIDPSKAMRKACRKKYPELKVKAGDFLHIPLPPKSVDAIVSSYAFHHLTPAQKEKSVHEMKRVLRDNGRIVIADLMFENNDKEKEIKQELRESGRKDVLDVIEDEYFSLFDNLHNWFVNEGFDFWGEQLTPFVWIFSAVLKGK